MSLTDRDKKIVMVVIPLVFVLAYWFLLLAPKREEASKAATELTEQEQKRDDVTAQAARLESAKASFARDYRDVVRLGKAIPSSVDMPSLIVQLDKAARGTGIKFTRVKAGERTTATAGGGAQGAGGEQSKSGDSSKPPASGGSQPAQSQPGSAAQTATNTANDASAQTNAQSSGGDNATDTTTSTPSKSGGLPVGGGAGGAAGGRGGASTAPGLDSVPLEFTFDGSFFDLADFFHKLKRFVRVTNKDVLVSGRLMTIDGMKFASEENSFPDLKVEVKATVYLSPKGQGTTAGASPEGPSTTQSASAPSDSGSPAPATPTAAATP